MKQDVKIVTVLSKWCCKEQELCAMLSFKSKQYCQYLKPSCCVFARQRCSSQYLCLTRLSQVCGVLSNHQSAVCLLNWGRGNHLWKVNHHHHPKTGALLYTSFNNDFPIRNSYCQDNIIVCSFGFLIL